MSDVENCLFCGIIAGRIPATIVYEDDNVVGFEDINKQAPTHVLFVPREHIATVNDLQDEHAQTVGELFLAARNFARSTGINADGYRLVMNCNAHAGQTVFHIHLHLLAGAPLRGGFGA
ncbi:MAG: histidine triad nucleotide-binding protein [Pseudomonadota bacterium]